MTRAEQETTIRWDADERIAWLWTAEEAQAERHGSWWARVPAAAIRFRPVKDGQLVRQKAHGRPFCPRNSGSAADEAPRVSCGGLVEN